MRTDPAAAIDPALSPRGAERPDGGLVAEVVLFWRDFVVAAFNPYRPEKHYMRGPGPAWHAKHRLARPTTAADANL
jgi:hypothetical protein